MIWAYSVLEPHPEVRSLNFELEIDFISNQYKTVQTKQHTIEQLIHDTVSR